MVGSGVAHDNEAGLQESIYLIYKIGKRKVLLGVLVSKCTWGPLSAQVVGLGVCGELENGSLSVLSVGNNLQAHSVSTSLSRKRRHIFLMKFRLHPVTIQIMRKKATAGEYLRGCLLGWGWQR